MAPQPPKARLARGHCSARTAEQLLLGTDTAAGVSGEVGQRKGNEMRQVDTKRKLTEYIDKKTKMHDLNTATTS